MRCLLIGSVLWGLLQAGSARAGDGLATRYPGDVGLEKDPEVVLFESFDSADLKSVLARWDDVSNKAGKVLSLIEDGPDAATGQNRRCLRMEAHPGEDTGGHLYKRLPRGEDELYVRFYVKFPEPASYVHHFVHVGGYSPPTRYPQGGAGDRPRGDERITVGIEPFGREGSLTPPGAWNFYAYWHEMKVSADGRYWGNAIAPAEPAHVPVNRWQCVEQRIRLNTVGQADGVLGLWLDGKPLLDVKRGVPRGPWTGQGFEVKETAPDAFEGFDFRTSDQLKLNFVWLLHYVTPENQARNHAKDPLRPNVVLFDQVVAARRYIGPVSMPR